MSSLTNEIKGQLSRYVSGELAPDAFHGWSALALLQANRTGDSDSESLLHSIEWELLDVERGISSVAVAKERLSSLTLIVAEIQAPCNIVETELSDVAVVVPSSYESATRRSLIQTELTFCGAGA